MVRNWYYTNHDHLQVKCFLCVCVLFVVVVVVVFFIERNNQAGKIESKKEKINEQKGKNTSIIIKHFKSRLSLIVRVNVVLNMTVVVDSD